MFTKTPLELKAPLVEDATVAAVLQALGLAHARPVGRSDLHTQHRYIRGMCEWRSVPKKRTSLYRRTICTTILQP
jgi:hypothetical protein